MKTLIAIISGIALLFVGIYAFKTAHPSCDNLVASRIQEGKIPSGKDVNYSDASGKCVALFKGSGIISSSILYDVKEDKVLFFTNNVANDPQGLTCRGNATCLTGAQFEEKKKEFKLTNVK